MAMPIDFQTMYSQISNISQNVSAQQNAAQLSEYSQQQIKTQQNLENSTKVQQTATEKSNAANVNKDGRGGGGYSSFSKKRNKSDSETEDIISTDSYDRVKEAHLGNIIDITR